MYKCWENVCKKEHYIYNCNSDTKKLSCAKKLWEEIYFVDTNKNVRKILFEKEMRYKKEKTIRVFTMTSFMNREELNRDKYKKA